MNRLRNFCFLLKSLTRLTTKRFEEHASELGLDLPQCKVLVSLAGNEGVSQARLAELTETDPMTLVRMLDRMELDRWIERRPDPADRRANCLYLSNEAKPILKRIWTIVDQAHAEAFFGLGAAECNRLVDLLERVHANLSELDAGRPLRVPTLPLRQRGRG